MSGKTPPLVLHVMHHLVTGGLENGVVNLINHMPESAFRHGIVCIEDYSDFRDRIVRRDVPVIALKRSRIGVWAMRRELYKLCRTLRPAILHTRNQSALDALLPARLAGVRHAVHGEHGWDVDNLRGDRWKPALLRQLHSPLIERYVTVSQNLQRYLTGRVGIAPASISQIYNGVDTTRFTPREDGPRCAMPAGFARGDTLIIGTVGRMQPVKDQATLLRAFAGLAPRHARARLVMAGSGPLAADLRALAAALGVGERVWFPGTVHDVAGVLRNIDVFVLPSLSEGISNTLLEAMASGVPTLATSVGGNPELVQEGLTGRLFQPGDVPALSRLLDDYLTQPALRLAHGAAARRVAVERFSLPAMVAHYQSVYQQLCH
ncbi:TIGR03088 family PEP-CTERM/XrtA system glycosyltransferase [Janthinobacterium rivuli]|uniref:TIGR03088 family PEP-CTERM/XrtA system glycosyltransferase n=1 Tax=Janthinobacterium sp. FT68W TaxID=2654255 RepID=UPI0012652C04|nr:TIGR03088 family PEP-CTERM/XrtA system glycosyltransferase [Janthinobacterium sp. FT68W]KAB8050431.1 TIGR03088 family PEP-CTERM/XrtA system glycosyltransferase [Janthinobacterium sp. FT68W]